MHNNTIYTKIKKNIPLAPLTTFKIGGLAKFFIKAKDEGEIKGAVAWAKRRKVPFFILGGGSNLLVSDNGFFGLVIRVVDNDLKINGQEIYSGVGNPLSVVVNEAVKFGLSGLEWAAGLPGTVGGAVAVSAGSFGFSIKDVVKSVKVYNIQKNKIQNFSVKDCGFSYRQSVFKKNKNLIILSVTFCLSPGKKENILDKMEENIKYRAVTQPTGFSPGSIFKHLEATKENISLLKNLPGFYNLKIHEQGTIPAGFTIEKCGLKGKKIGRAMISEKHANFIVNTGKATADEVAMLISFIKQQVRDKFGVQLEEEIQYLGF